MLYVDVVSFFFTKNVPKSGNLMKIVNIYRENLNTYWTTWVILMNFPEKIWLMTILKVTKKQGFTLSLFGKTTRRQMEFRSPSNLRLNLQIFYPSQYCWEIWHYQDAKMQTLAWLERLFRSSTRMRLSQISM